MSDFRFLSRRPDGTVRSYILRSKKVKLRKGKEVKIYFFAREDGSAVATPAYKLHGDQPRRQPLSPHVQAALAKVLVQMAKESPEDAADIVKMIEVVGEDLTSEQAEQVVSDITAMLDKQE